MINFRVDDQVHGQYNATMKCNKCSLAVFSGLSNDRDRVERVIRQRFNELHIGCDAEEMPLTSED